MFAKVFSQIFDSSIAEDPRLRHFFMDMLVLADRDGVVDMTPGAIAGRTRIPVDEVKGYLDRLEQPDGESRSSDAEGRRIVRLDGSRTWGWRITNYPKYRMIASEEQRRDKTRARVERFRAEKVEAKVDKPQSPSEPPAPSLPLVEVFEAWNKLDGVPKTLLLSDKRRQTLKVRLGEKFFEENWRAAMLKVQASSFCRGESERGWVASFDWFIGRDSVAKIMEGKYDNRNRTPVMPSRKKTEKEIVAEAQS